MIIYNMHDIRTAVNLDKLVITKEDIILNL